MAEITEKLGLIKPAQTDYYNIEDFNQNADALERYATENDAAVAAKYAKPLRFHDVSVAGSLWAGDGTHADYAYKCDIALAGVTADMTPDVVLPLAVAVGGEVAPIAESGAGYVRLYASAAQSDMVIPTITVWKEV